MSASIIGYNNIKVSPFNLNRLLELKIERKINEHAKISLTGVIAEEERDKYVEIAQTQTKLEVTYISELGEKPIFIGIITNIEVRVVRGIFHIVVEGVSNTFNMDVKLKKRSFQNKDMAIKELVEKVAADYPGSDFIDTASNDDKTKKFIIQYDETDWEFLKRIASRLNAGLVPDILSGKTSFWFGIPKGKDVGQLEDYHYTIKKEIGLFRNSSENFIDGISDIDFIRYETESDIIVNIGDMVTFKGKKLYVLEATAIMTDGILKSEYVLTTENGLKQNKIYNEGVKGASVEGKVIEVKEDNVRIHLEIDKEQKKDEAYWFPYSTPYTTEGNTGWYCMPELDDSVKLYFPTNKEEDGITINSIRKRTKGGDIIKDPDIKVFRTSFGKEIRFTKDEITIIGKDNEVMIRLIGDEGIELYSKKDIRVIADAGITMESENTVQIIAKNTIGLKCKESLIEMDGVTTINGSQVKNN